MWMYVYYSIYLDQIDTSNHNAIEKYVYEKVSICIISDSYSSYVMTHVSSYITYTSQAQFLPYVYGASIKAREQIFGFMLIVSCPDPTLGLCEGKGVW